MESLSHSLMALVLVVLTFVVPFVVLFFAFKAREGKSSRKALLLMIGLQLCVSATGYLTLKTGEFEEEKVEGIVEKKLIQEHESGAEIMVGIASVATILAITTFFLAPALRFKMMMVVAGLGFFSGSLGILSGSRGKDLVSARMTTPTYDKKSQTNVPGQFSTTPSVNESLTPDENDYEGIEDEGQIEDDDKQED